MPKINVALVVFRTQERDSIQVAGVTSAKVTNQIQGKLPYLVINAHDGTYNFNMEEVAIWSIKTVEYEKPAEEKVEAEEKSKPKPSKNE